MKYPAYPLYKDSGVVWLGEVPMDWQVKRGRFSMSVNPPSPKMRALEQDEEVSFLPMDAISEYGGLRLSEAKIKAEVGGGYTEFQDGDVVIAKITPCFENAKGSLVSDLLNSVAYGTTELHVLRTFRHLDNRFLFYITITHGFRKLGESEMYGAGGQKRVPPEFCKDFRIPLPQIAEQTAIADFLDRKTGRIDTLVAKKRKLMALLKEKRSALISRTVTRGLPADAAREFGLATDNAAAHDVPDTYTRGEASLACRGEKFFAPTEGNGIPGRLKDSGVEWLGEVPTHWEFKQLKWAVMFQRGHDIPSDARIEGTVPIVSSAGISGAHNLAIAKAPGIVTGRYGTIGQFHLLLEDYWPLNTTLYSIDLHGNDPVFLRYYLEHLSPLVLLHSVKSAVPGVDRNDLHPTMVALPPLEEQTSIVAYLDRETAKIDRLVAKVETAITRLQEYRSALITAAVTGKIDVREAL